MTDTNETPAVDPDRTFCVTLVMPLTLARAALMYDPSDPEEIEESSDESAFFDIVQQGLGQRIDKILGPDAADAQRVKVSLQFPEDGEPSYTASYEADDSPLDETDRAAVESAYNDMIATYRGRTGLGGVE